jgi:hypothetical protein
MRRSYYRDRVANQNGIWSIEVSIILQETRANLRCRAKGYCHVAFPGESAIADTYNLRHVSEVGLRGWSLPVAIAIDLNVQGTTTLKYGLY